MVKLPLMKETIWEKRAEKVELTTFTEFARTINRLPIKVSDIQGDVLVGGHGSAFPERLLICSPESYFERLEKRITSLTTADLSPITNPELLLAHPVLIGRRGNIPKFEKNSVTHYPTSLKEFLPFLPDDIFNTALFFRINRLQEQLDTFGLLKEIRRVIKPMGIFTGSGSFESYQDAEKILSSKFDTVILAQLKNPDPTGYIYKTHIGFICKK